MAKRVEPATPPGKITRDDLEQRFRDLQDGVLGQVRDKRSTFVTVGGAAGLVLVLLIFLLGRRSGKKKTTFVEIRRV